MSKRAYSKPEREQTGQSLLVAARESAKASVIKKSWWYLLVVLVTAAALAGFFSLRSYQNQYQTAVVPLGFLGSYQLDDGTPPQPLTDSTYIDACDTGSVTLRGSFSRTLKSDTQIFFFMEYLQVQIYHNDQQIYSWGTAGSYPPTMRSAGAAWGHCVLPVAIAPGDEVTIVLQSQYTNNYNSAYHDFLASLQTGDSGALARTVLAKSWPYLLVGLLLALIGLALLLLVLSLTKQGIALHPSVNYSALFILSASVWILLNPEYSTLLFGNSLLIMQLETIFMWLFSIFLVGYFATFMHTKAKQASDLLCFCLLLAMGLFLVLQRLGITDAYAVREPYTLLLGVSAAVFFLILWHEVRHVRKTELYTLALPGLLYMVFGLVELLNYSFEWLPRGAAVAVGFCVFVLTQFVLAGRQIGNSLQMALQAAKLEKSLAESRTAVVLSQIQPHFLYNALTGIKTLCGSDPEQAEKAMEHFSFFLRGNLDSLSDVRLITFDKEIGHVQDYFYLEKMRFKDRVSLALQLEFRDFLLPSLILQPLVENAVRYGITKKDDGGTITITSQHRDGQVVILIADDGVGFDVNAPQTDGRSHTGIENVRSRLKLQCNGFLEIESQKGVGTTVKITLPDREEIR